MSKTNRKQFITMGGILVILAIVAGVLVIIISHNNSQNDKETSAETSETEEDIVESIQNVEEITTNYIDLSSEDNLEAHSMADAIEETIQEVQLDWTMENRPNEFLEYLTEKRLYDKLAARGYILSNSEFEPEDSDDPLLNSTNETREFYLVNEANGTYLETSFSINDNGFIDFTKQLYKYRS